MQVSKKLFTLLLTTLAAFASQSPLSSQPSGGPYGPIQQSYAIPESGSVFHVSPNGSATSKGFNQESPTTLKNALSLARTGDSIILRGGEYRTGSLSFNQGITIQPYADERPIIKGTQIAKNWEKVAGELWRTKWESLFPAEPADWWQRENEAAFTPKYLFNNDMVFRDGALLKPVGWAGAIKDETSYYIDYAQNYVYVGFDPNSTLMEITAHDSALVRVDGPIGDLPSDGIGPTISGIVFTQYAYRALEVEGVFAEAHLPESEYGKNVTGTTIEHCEITYCSRVAGYFYGDNLIIRNCLVSDTSTEGLYVISSADVLLEKNIVRRNNIEGITGYYPAAVKIFNQCYRAICRDNLIIDHPDSAGIWYDVGNIEGLIENNWFENVRKGFFFEISKTATLRRNVFLNCKVGAAVQNSSDVTIEQNTFANATLSIERDDRGMEADHFGWHVTSGPDYDKREGQIVRNNLLYSDEDYTRRLLLLHQSPVLRDKLTTPQLAELDNNIFVRNPPLDEESMILWSPGDETANWLDFYSLEELAKKHPDFAQGNTELRNYRKGVFQSKKLKRLHTLDTFPHQDVGAYAK
ncbi:right-handed parallel beta-helix repeat-containing protein [Pelagicoccus mobilis]|uniref:Right-handed parallel beta-helix repeat-containing protein n=1 Tax=Pelagicoccus mobilis TaxID=415221 RepID=A0A934S476_9BACT|nr:right-handed parallel beta-helix repeat-containing protein [Pelagicoccus mobilis]MBK1878718.1 right-handed parallel beta-helix repeat-containing protein [Pelagicoccus mobilis]